MLNQVIAQTFKLLESLSRPNAQTLLVGRPHGFGHSLACAHRAGYRLRNALSYGFLKSGKLTTVFLRLLPLTLTCSSFSKEC